MGIMASSCNVHADTASAEPYDILVTVISLRCSREGKKRCMPTDSSDTLSSGLLCEEKLIQLKAELRVMSVAVDIEP